MVFIDKTKASVKLLFTLTEMAAGADPTFQLELYSPFTNKTHLFTLPANTSAYKSRYDEFIINTSVFKDVEAGKYYYKVYEGAAVLENGIAEVREAVDDFVSITPAETEDDFITYKG